MLLPRRERIATIFSLKENLNNGSPTGGPPSRRAKSKNRIREESRKCFPPVPAWSGFYFAEKTIQIADRSFCHSGRAIARPVVMQTRNHDRPS